MKLILMITEKGKSEVVLKFASQMNLLFSVTLIGTGTASSEILEVLSLVKTDKDVVIAFADDKDVKEIFHKLEEELQFSKKKLGVACAMNLNGTTEKTLKHIKSNMVIGDK